MKTQKVRIGRTQKNSLEGSKRERSKRHTHAKENAKLKNKDKIRNCVTKIKTSLGTLVQHL